MNSIAKIQGLQGVVAKSASLSESGIRKLMTMRPEIWVEHESVVDPLDEDAEDEQAEDFLVLPSIPDDEQLVAGKHGSRICLT